MCLNLLHLKDSKCKLENEIFFLILPKYNSTRAQQLQHWYSKCNSKEFEMGEREMGEQLKV